MSVPSGTRSVPSLQIQGGQERSATLQTARSIAQAHRTPRRVRAPQPIGSCTFFPFMDWPPCSPSPAERELLKAGGHDPLLTTLSLTLSWVPGSWWALVPTCGINEQMVYQHQEEAWETKPGGILGDWGHREIQSKDR